MFVSVHCAVLAVTSYSRCKDLYEIWLKDKQEWVGQTQCYRSYAAVYWLQCNLLTTWQTHCCLQSVRLVQEHLPVFLGSPWETESMYVWSRTIGLLAQYLTNSLWDLCQVYKVGTVSDEHWNWLEFEAKGQRGQQDHMWSNRHSRMHVFTCPRNTWMYFDETCYSYTLPHACDPDDFRNVIHSKVKVTGNI